MRKCRELIFIEGKHAYLTIVETNPIIGIIACEWKLIIFSVWFAIWKESNHSTVVINEFLGL